MGGAAAPQFAMTDDGAIKNGMRVVDLFISDHTHLWWLLFCCGVQRVWCQGALSLLDVRNKRISIVQSFKFN